VVVALLFSVLGTLRGVRHVARCRRPRPCARRPPPAGGRILLERLPLALAAFGFRWQTALRNLFRNRGRSLVGIIAAALGTAILVATFGLVDSLKYLVQFQFDKVLLADYRLDFRTPLDQGALLEAGRLPGVTRAEPLFYVDGRAGPRQSPPPGRRHRRAARCHHDRAAQRRRQHRRRCPSGGC
jgi:putative ABC transport system permease protein